MLKTQVVGCCFGIPFGCGTLLFLATALALWGWGGLHWLPF